MPKCHDGWRLSVSALGTCFATFRKPSSIMQSFVITSSLATKKCSFKSRNTKLCATPRKQWIYEKLHYTPPTQRRELHKPSVILKRWRLVQNYSILYTCVSSLRNVILPLSLLPSWFMRQEWKRKQVTKVTKCPWLHFLKCHRLTTLNPREVVCFVIAALAVHIFVFVSLISNRWIVNVSIELHLYLCNLVWISYLLQLLY